VSEFTGATIKEVREMTPAEMQTEGWESRSFIPCIVLDTGAVLYASSDEEGNNPGALFGHDGDRTFMVAVV